MYCYKLNNSYTIYVNYAYLNDCIKASREKGVKTGTICTKSCTRDVSIPLPINACVKHKLWGEGSLVSKERSGIFTVDFGGQTVRFFYPDALKNGHLVKTG